MKFKELEAVVLITDHPESGVRRGDLGTVVAVYEGGRGLEVEFFRATGDTKAVVTLASTEVRRAHRSEVIAVRGARRSA